MPFPFSSDMPLPKFAGASMLRESSRESWFVLSSRFLCLCLRPCACVLQIFLLTVGTAVYRQPFQGFFLPVFCLVLLSPFQHHALIILLRSCPFFFLGYIHVHFPTHALPTKMMFPITIFFLQ